MIARKTNPKQYSSELAEAKNNLVKFLDSLDQFIHVSECKNDLELMNFLSTVFFEKDRAGVCHALIKNWVVTSEQITVAVAKAGHSDCLRALMASYSQIKPESVVLSAVQGGLINDAMAMIPNCADPRHAAKMAVGKALSTGQGDFAKLLIKTFELPIETLIGSAVEGGLSQYCEGIWEYKVAHPEGSYPKMALNSLAILIANPLSKKPKAEIKAWLDSIKIPEYKDCLLDKLDFCANSEEKLRSIFSLPASTIIVKNSALWQTEAAQPKSDGNPSITSDEKAAPSLVSSFSGS
jgi:hypothetical protein